MERRDFLALAVKTGGALAAGAVLVPVAVTTLSPLRETRRPGTWARVGELDAFPAGKVTLAVVESPRGDWAKSLRRRGVYVWRPAGDEVAVYSRSCTDLGCPVTWDAGAGWFFCPCHGAIFDREGVPRKGPPKLPLRRYGHRIVAGALEIDLDSLPPEA